MIKLHQNKLKTLIIHHLIQDNNVFQYMIIPIFNILNLLLKILLK